MKINFDVLKDKKLIKKFVMSHLSKEASDIPEEKIEGMIWELKELDIKDITWDNKLAREHETQEVHIHRKEFQKDWMSSGKPVKPLIVMYDNNWLVDGYARLRALKSLCIKKVKVYSGHYLKNE